MHCSSPNGCLWHAACQERHVQLLILDSCRHIMSLTYQHSLCTSAVKSEKGYDPILSPCAKHSGLNLSAHTKATSALPVLSYNMHSVQAPARLYLQAGCHLIKKGFNRQWPRLPSCNIRYNIANTHHAEQASNYCRITTVAFAPRSWHGAWQTVSASDKDCIDLTAQGLLTTVAAPDGQPNMRHRAAQFPPIALILLTLSG